MTTGNKAIIGAAVIAGFIFFTNSGKDESLGLTNDDVQSIIVETEQGFDLAEQKVLGNKPKPGPEPSGPDPDPDKCICKGTGKIVQGDGHVSKCPYHGSKDVATNVCGCGCNSEGCDCQLRSSRSSGYTQRRGLLGRLFNR